MGTSSDSENITKNYLLQALDALSQKLITTWYYSMDYLRKDVQELGKRTSHIESKMDDYATAHPQLLHGQTSLPLFLFT
ncbi:Hypothetical predicted protein [Pelobates cultripes]|uniref:Uncharacterized protein n=1 Tax=Pelobates cultripes TaxID=61616 RepID=A0AAD1VKA8_PELCU|nr:Hypothetical predicted protein [Pelobates cultripes]